MQNAPGALDVAVRSMLWRGAVYFFIGSVAMIMLSRSAMSVSLQLPQMASICGCGGPAALGMMPSVCTLSRSPKKTVISAEHCETTMQRVHGQR